MQQLDLYTIRWDFNSQRLILENNTFWDYKHEPPVFSRPTLLPNPALSGRQWCERFLGSNSTTTLASPFKDSVDKFIKTLRDAGAAVTVSSTLRPAKRALLMHWSWMIAKGRVKPEDVPAITGINIEWVHSTKEESIKAAIAMVARYGTNHLTVPPATTSNHIAGNAIDMNISWNDDLIIKNVKGESVTITSAPKTGMNKDLHAIAKGYGVIKFRGGDTDKPHWSSNGG